MTDMSSTTPKAVDNKPKYSSLSEKNSFIKHNGKYLFLYFIVKVKEIILTWRSAACYSGGLAKARTRAKGVVLHYHWDELRPRLWQTAR